VTDPPCEVSFTNKACLKNTVQLDKDDKDGSVPSFLFIPFVDILFTHRDFQLFAKTLPACRVAVYFQWISMVMVLLMIMV